MRMSGEGAVSCVRCRRALTIGALDLHIGTRPCLRRAAKIMMDARGLVDAGQSCYAVARQAGFDGVLIDGRGHVHENAEPNTDYGEGRYVLDRIYCVEPWVRDVHHSLGSALITAKVAVLLRCAVDPKVMDFVLTAHRLGGEKGARAAARVVLDRKWDLPDEPPPGAARVRSRRAAP